MWILIGGGVLLVLLGGGIVIAAILVARRTPVAAPVAASGDDNPNLESKPSGTSTSTSTSTKPTATTTSRFGGTPTVGTTSSRPPPFPRARASADVDRVAAGAQSCHVSGDPTGTGSMRIDFEPNGNVATVTRKPFAFTTTGECVSARMRAIRIGAFDGKSAESIETTFFIKGTAPTPSSSTKR